MLKILFSCFTDKIRTWGSGQREDSSCNEFLLTFSSSPTEKAVCCEVHP